MVTRAASGLCSVCHPDPWSSYASVPPVPKGVDVSRDGGVSHEVWIDGQKLTTCVRAVAGDPGWALVVLTVDDQPYATNPSPIHIGICRLHGQIRYDVLRGRVEIRPATPLVHVRVVGGDCVAVAEPVSE